MLISALSALRNLLLALALTPLLALAGTAGMARAETPVKLACTSFPPFKIQDETGKRLGIDVDVARAALKHAGYQAQFSFSPWKRTLKLAELGEVDGLCGCSYLPEREEKFVFSDILGIQSQGVFLAQKAEKKQIAHLDDLAGLRVAAVRGYAVIEDLKGRNIEVFEANDDRQLLRMLMAGRVDAVYTYRDILLYNYALSGAQGDIHYYEISSQPYYLCLSRTNERAEQLAKDFNRGLRQLRFDGRYREIWESYR